MREFNLPVVTALVITASIIGATVGGYTAVTMTQPSTAPAPTQPVDSIRADHPVNESLYRQAYDRYMDSVVSIKTSSPYGGGQGTGWVYDNNGHIVTNHHVIQGASQVEVRFRNGDWRTADVIGTDVYSDLAVLKVDNPPKNAQPLPVAQQDPEPGSLVMALGNPFGLQETITHGIISGVDRTMQTTGGFTIPNVVQTDAPINPGNSGGPLVNENGVVVGVNRAKQGDNIGFAIPPSIIRRVVPALIQDGDYNHPYLGITMEGVSPQIADANNLEQTEGIIVVNTVDGGPADGVLQGSTRGAYTRQGTIPVGGDVIRAIDGKDVDKPQDLSAYLATETSPGDTVTLTIIRNGEQQQVTVRLGQRPEPRQYY